MTDSLIDRDGLTEAINRGYDSMEYSSADAVMAYLRSVLTPEALRTHGWDQTEGYVYLEGADLHRRIFGEDK